MKPIQLYQCEICGIQYKDRLAAENCEESHSLPVKICDYKYLKGAEYPTEISIKFCNGEIQKYKR